MLVPSVLKYKTLDFRARLVYVSRETFTGLFLSRSPEVRASDVSPVVVPPINMKVSPYDIVVVSAGRWRRYV